MYWTDNRQHALLQADKETGTQLDILEKNLEIPMTVAAFSRNKKPGTKIDMYAAYTCSQTATYPLPLSIFMLHLI